jgi:hypothetical protein
MLGITPKKYDVSWHVGLAEAAEIKHMDATATNKEWAIKLVKSKLGANTIKEKQLCRFKAKKLK